MRVVFYFGFNLQAELMFLHKLYATTYAYALV